jgi:mono/diheme cytochrome c family protein
LPFDVATDERRWRAALVVSALAAVSLLGMAVARELGAEWRAELKARGGSEVAEVRACNAYADRCTTCHAEDAETAVEGASARPCSFDLREHQPRVVGCAACHGGTPPALDAAAAHAVTGHGQRDPLMKAPVLEAACVRCHLPGAVAGTERAARGADLFLRLGCAVCHSPAAGGRGGADFGPDLRGIGRHSIEYLRDNLFVPTRNFPGSTMPSYEHSFANDPRALEDLLIYVVALALEPLAGCDAGDRGAALVHQPCSVCHGGAGGIAGGRFTHACVYIVARPELRCGACHPGAVPAAGAQSGDCPVVREHRAACAACHAVAPAW